MLRTFRNAVLLTAGFAICQISLGASGSSVPAPSGGGGSSMRTMTPEERAVDAFRSGDDHRVKGKKLESEALAKQGNDAVKTSAKAHSEFEKSLKDFKNAVKLNPNLFQAYNGMGYAYRKMGDYAQALESYDQAIKLAAPKFFPEAVEYRAEAYLALNRLDDARQAYLDLFAADRGQADILMAAMKSWVASRQANPAGVAPEVVSGFEKWIGEREGLARQTRLMGVSTQYAGW
jgi:tetratricopeptide (TPR) repeat protein